MNHQIDSDKKLLLFFKNKRQVGDRIKISLPSLIFISEITEVHPEEQGSMVLLKNGFSLFKDKKHITIIRRIGITDPSNFYKCEHYDNYVF